jgi:hypothetical protein
MPLKGSMAVMTFQNAAFRQDFDNKMQEILKSCVKVWLSVAVSKIPTWSGMSRGTLLKLAEKVNYQISIFPTPNGQRREPGGISEGMDKSKGELLIQFPRYGFYWESTVKRLNINDAYDSRQWGFRLITPGPYHFRVTADAAFKDAALKMIRKINYNIRRFVKITNVKIG